MTADEQNSAGNAHGLRHRQVVGRAGFQVRNCVCTKIAVVLGVSFRV